jgi:Fic-DOC domain mobile mystery protein B
LTTESSPESSTPLTADERADLIPDLTTLEELNEWERQNIFDAARWALGPRSLQRNNPLTEAFVRDLHRRMFSRTWEWAGAYRDSEKNIGVPAYAIREELGKLLPDAQFWVENETYPLEEIAIRLHHRLVLIHPFPNGNGRHARLMADVLLRRAGLSALTWGRVNLAKDGNFRKHYIAALRAADAGDIKPLLAFART